MTAIYVIAAMVMLVWGALFVLRGSLMGGCLMFLLVAACFGHDFFNVHLGALPLTLDRLVLLLLLVAYVFQRRLGHTEPKPLGRVDLLLMVFLGVLVLSTFRGILGGSQTGQVDRFEPLFRLGAGYVIPFVLYWIARQSPLDRSSISLAQGTLACLGVYLATTGLLEITGQWWAVFPKHIADPEVGIHFGRARGPMVHAVSFGLCLGMSLLAAWMWRWRHGRAGQLVIAALMPLMLAGIFFSYTRSVWMGTGLGMLIVLGLTLRGSWRPLVLGGTISAVLLLAVTQMDKIKGFRREHSAANTRMSVDLRGGLAYVSWKMFLDRPLWGVGFGQFPAAKLPYLSDRSTELNLEVTRPLVHHNMFLSVLTETGLIGLALFLAILAGWGRAAWDLAHGFQVPNWARAQGILLLGVLGVYVCQAMFHELTYTPLDNSLVFFLAGMTVGLRQSAKLETAPAHAGLGNAQFSCAAAT